MGRHKKQSINIKKTTIAVTENVQEYLFNEKRRGETLSDTMNRIVYWYDESKEIIENYSFLETQYNNQCTLTQKYIEENKQLRDTIIKNEYYDNNMHIHTAKKV